jgi:hypothetical protein
MYSYTSDIYSPPIGFYNQINVENLNKSEMQQLIGKNRCNFKRITKKYRLKYIWWNKERNIIEIWGRTFDLTEKKNKIINYINNFQFLQKHQNYNTAIFVEDLHLTSSIIDNIFEF